MAKAMPGRGRWFFGGIILTGLILLGAVVWSRSGRPEDEEPAEVEIDQLDPGTLGKNPFKATFTKAGVLRIYWCSPIAKSSFKIKVNNGAVKNIANVPSGSLQQCAVKDTGIKVKANDKVQVEVFETANFQHPGFTWVKVKNDKCPVGDGGPITDAKVKRWMNQARAGKKPIEAAQCWSDWDTRNEAEPDNNDYLVILSYKPEASPSPKPSPSKSPRPSPSKSPRPSPSSDPDPSPDPSPSPDPDPSDDPDPSPDSSQPPAASPSPKPNFPPGQPDTGTPTWLTAAVLLAAAGLLGYKLKLTAKGKPWRQRRKKRKST